jgi:hypothetical protein
MVAQPSPGAFATIVFSFKLRIARIAIPPKSLSSSAGRNSHVFSFPHLPCLSRGVVSSMTILHLISLQWALVPVTNTRYKVFIMTFYPLLWDELVKGLR